VISEKFRILKTVEFPTAHIEFWDNGIVYYKLADEVEIELQDSINHSEAILNNPPDGYKKYLILVVSGTKTTITKEAREYGENSPAHAITQAMAVVTDSLSQRIIINFIFLFFKRKNVSVKLFENKEKAIEWLLSFERE